MGNIFFTSDTHFDDDRLEIFSRPFKTVKEMNDTIVKNWNSVVSKDDTVYHLGDFAVDPSGYDFVKKLNGKIHLILGNYDIDNIDKFDHKLFESIQKDMTLDIKGTEYYITHKPTETIPDQFNLCGHIHGLWRVANRNIINVGTDAWHFYPIPDSKIEFQRNGMVNHYDDNVFVTEYMMNKTANKNEFDSNFTW